MLTNIKYIVCTLWSIEEFALTSLMIRLDGFLCLPWHFFAQLPLGMNAAFSLKPRGLFISFARTKETKQRKFAVCTFLPTPALFSAKQKELASLKQLFVFHAPKSTCASRQKSEAGSLCFFYATSLRSLVCDVFPSSLRFFVIQTIPLSKNQMRFSMSVANNVAKRSEGSRLHPHHERSDVPSREGYFRPQWRSVKKNQVFSVKNEKLFERSEFFSFRKICGFFSSGA